MHVITVNYVGEALASGLMYLKAHGNREQSRNGEVIVAPGPVSTVYRFPEQRVLLNRERNANPFLHLFEALWILAGRRDVGFLTMFASRFADFSDDGKTFHAAYGHRLRQHFGVDQIGLACEMLRENPTSRRVVLQIWDMKADLNRDSKDLPCNDMIMCRVSDGKLHITVCNRSNDAIWGAYGANVVQFSTIQEYMAGRIGCDMGEYTQMSFNLHAYSWNEYWQHFDRFGSYYAPNPYYKPNDLGVYSYPLMKDIRGDTQKFDDALNAMFDIYDRAEHYASRDGELNRRLEYFADGCELVNWSDYKVPYFEQVVMPMLFAYAAHKDREYSLRDGGIYAALERTKIVNGDARLDIDWLVAAQQWFSNADAKRTVGLVNEIEAARKAGGANVG